MAVLRMRRVRNLRANSMTAVMARTTRVAPLRRNWLVSKENLPLTGKESDRRLYFASGKPREVATRACRGKVAAILERWEQQTPSPESRTPRLKTRRGVRPDASKEEEDVVTQCLVKSDQGGVSPPCGEPQEPGRMVQEAQRVLIQKHNEAKSKLEGVSGIGGGVSIWPAMDDMRLSREDALQLVKLCLCLVMVTAAIFYCCHGSQIARLRQYTSEMSEFSAQHPLSALSSATIHEPVSQEVFEEELMQWHQDFLGLIASVQGDMNVELSRVSLFDVVFLLSYVSGVASLLYFLLDNMLSKSRLTPRRIKVWISLLCVVATWTLLSVYLLVCVQSLETVTQNAVHSLSDELAYLVQTPLDLTQYHSVLLYWRTRILPPTTRGVLSILGIVQVQNVAYYLQYYSLPILTAICTPVAKIIISLWTVYRR